MYAHPPTPQSYQSGSSPYQNNDAASFSPNFQNFQPIKSEKTSPTPTPQTQILQPNYNNFNDSLYFSMDHNPNLQYSQDSFVQKPVLPNSGYLRYHPYQNQNQQNSYDCQLQTQLPSSRPVYPPQPTPSPSPKICDKCGFVCESAAQLTDHLNIAHPPTPASHLYQPNQHFMFGHHQIKQEEPAEREILDLDSQKVVHNIFPEEDKRQDEESSSPHHVTGLVNSWSSSQQQQKVYGSPEHRVFMNSGEQNMTENKIFQTDQKLFQSHQMHNPDFLGNGVTTNTQENVGNLMVQPPQPSYRSFQHLQQSPPTAPVLSSTQVPGNTAQPPVSQKSSTWKSNEARRPKTYNCTACNKWFTSSGHLKRHYNTTLHKNAVKSSGQPDPAYLPISAHHHPARESSITKQVDERSQSTTGDDMRNDENNGLPPQFDRLPSMPGLIQHPPSGPYDRHPAPNIHHTPPHLSPMTSPMAHSPMQPPHQSPLGNHMNPNLSNGSPPNGDAGLSTNNLDSRGLPSIGTPINTGKIHHGFNMSHQHLMSMENNQFQMYPNELAPHVMQTMAINNPSTIGDYSFDGTQNSQVDENQPLPSFAQIQTLRYGISGYDVANVGGGGTVTTPLSYYSEPQDVSEMRTVIYQDNNNEYNRVTVIPSEEQTGIHNEFILGFPPSQNINHEEAITLVSVESEPNSKVHIVEDITQRLEEQPESPEKAHIKRDYEESVKLISATVNKPGLHKCYVCDKVFNKACYLTQHNKTSHSGEKPYKCSRCGKRFSCEETYREHLSKHAGDKPHKCDLCPKQFNHKTDLRRHMCLHTGQKPYACNTCGKGFIRKDHMMKHCETHLRKTQSKIAAIR